VNVDTTIDYPQLMQIPIVQDLPNDGTGDFVSECHGLDGCSAVWYVRFNTTTNRRERRLHWERT
jgi:hypothetical protein